MAEFASTHAKTAARMPAPPTYAGEAVLNAEVDAVDAAEVMEGVVDDARVEEPDAEAEPDPDADLEARLANERSQKEGDSRRCRTR